MDFVQMYEGKNHFLYVDNFYTSPALLIELLKKEIYCKGTVRSNCMGFLNGLLPPNASMRHRFASSSTHNLTAVWWKDRKDVFVMHA